MIFLQRILNEGYQEIENEDYISYNGVANTKMV